MVYVNVVLMCVQMVYCSTLFSIIVLNHFPGTALLSYHYVVTDGTNLGFPVAWKCCVIDIIGLMIHGLVC